MKVLMCGHLVHLLEKNESKIEQHRAEQETESSQFHTVFEAHEEELDNGSRFTDVNVTVSWSHVAVIRDKQLVFAAGFPTDECLLACANKVKDTDERGFKDLTDVCRSCDKIKETGERSHTYVCQSCNKAKEGRSHIDVCPSCNKVKEPDGRSHVDVCQSCNKVKQPDGRSHIDVGQSFAKVMETCGKSLIDVCQSCNTTGYLSSEGICYIKIAGDSKWCQVAIQDTDDTVIMKAIKCGETHIVTLSEKNKAYVLCLRPVSSPLMFSPLAPKLHIKAVSCGKEHILLLTNIGIVLSYGGGSRGQLGHGSIDDMTSPCVVEALEASTCVAIAAGGWHSTAVTDIGDVYMWGWNESGQLGLPCQQASTTTENTLSEYVNVETEPHVLDLPLTSEEEKVTEVSCGSRHTAIVTDKGHLYTWGWNTYGQLGHHNMSKVIVDAPTRVIALDHYDIKTVHCGGWTSVASVCEKRKMS